jgi:hypothetical protein
MAQRTGGAQLWQQHRLGAAGAGSRFGAKTDVVTGAGPAVALGDVNGDGTPDVVSSTT